MTTMNYLLQHTKQTWIIQFILFFSLPIVELWKDAIKTKNLLNLIITLWVTGLMLLFLIGWSYLVFQFITNPSQFSNATFGVFDYI